MQANRYKITIRGRARYFDSLESATATANEIFARTGIIVGIEAA